jgi:hypothetical protein
MQVNELEQILDKYIYHRDCCTFLSNKILCDCNRGLTVYLLTTEVVEFLKRKGVSINANNV